MARLARIVVPGIAHHVTQRGNRRQQVFFCGEDAALYITLLAGQLRRHGTVCIAWCLMPNHVHLILVPAVEDGLRRPLGEAHRRYSLHVNRREGWTGYLWQGRFHSAPTDEPHLRNAVLYAERNPVAARLARWAEDWRWSSARARVHSTADPLADLSALDIRGLDWSRELESWSGAAKDEHQRALETGRPLGDAHFVQQLERRTRRALRPGKPGPKSARRMVSSV